MFFFGKWFFGINIGKYYYNGKAYYRGWIQLFNWLPKSYRFFGFEKSHYDAIVIYEFGLWFTNFSIAW